MDSTNLDPKACPWHPACRDRSSPTSGQWSRLEAHQLRLSHDMLTETQSTNDICININKYTAYIHNTTLLWDILYICVLHCTTIHLSLWIMFGISCSIMRATSILVKTELLVYIDFEELVEGLCIRFSEQPYLIRVASSYTLHIYNI